ncbi:MAG: GTP-binding protein [Candidatus Methanomethylicota archaeon]|uniref:GTP-binding protein n=1 Tax=Thermoproteota archaeon TaxID=2056631 RepID=A0A497F093_9CREN|nr:MAG: GTP-binding protein [Candidatus Verstraetearchaeota archaeon]
MLGITKSRKRALLAALTHATPEIADYPFTTTEPYPGMMHYQDVQIQLVEAPALAGLGGEELEWTPKVLSLARNADGIVLVVDGQNNPLEQAKLLVKVLYDSGITVERKDVKVEIEKTTIGGVQVVFMNKSIKFSPDDVRKLLLEHGVRNAVVKIWGEASLEDVAEALMTNRVYKPAVIAVNKLDDDLREGFDSVAKFFEDKIPVVNVSAVKKVGLDALKKTIYESLGIIRVYTKEVNGEVASRPLILKKGARVIDVAKAIHSQIYKNFKYARIWGPSVKYGGEKVGADHTLMDGDIVEIHTK